MTELVLYDAACRALAEAYAVDEVKNVHDQAEAIRHAARIAKNLDLEVKAAQLRFRAERRLGELIKAQKQTVGLAQGRRSDLLPSGKEVEPAKVTLKEAGIDHKLSSRAQKVAGLPAEKFESLLGQHAEEMRAGVGRVAMDLLKVNSEAEGAKSRREIAVALSNASADLPTGRKYPVIYADPPWHRNQGVTSRSYENHYPTMAWSEICAMPVKDLALPDAWLFLWIPRAHAFALHVIEIEAVAVETGELVKARVAMPLAYAVSKAWGFDDYSTAFVWTKTDEDHPDEGGGAILVRDQDELLLMFKRGNGLPKPEKKFGSNHRERSRPLGHSTKPQFYRDMIASMAGEGVPCLELFARFDPDRPAPLGWDLWGNQSDEKIDGVRNEAADMESAAVSAAPAIGVDTAQISAGAANEKCLFESVFLEPFETTPGSTERDPLDIPEFLLRKRPQLDLGLVVSPKVDVVDNHVQTRLPVNAMELEEAVGLRAIHAGDHPGDIARHLVGMGWAGCTTKALFLTDEGRAALAAFVDMPASQSAKQPAFDGLSSCETEILT